MTKPGEAELAAPVYRIEIDGEGVKVAKEIDAHTATDILALIMGGGPQGARQSPRRRTRQAGQGRTAKSRTGGGARPKAKRRAGSPGVVKDLSLRPKGKKSFVDFATEKQPKTHQQKQSVILYWLREVGGMTQGITTDHVNTCYLEAGWPRPSNLDNALQVTAKVKGWFDTSDMSDIKLTTRGEDEVKHSLPPQTKTQQR